MAVKRADLRGCARKALEQHGYSVEDAGGAGVAPGARLRIYKGTKPAKLVAVRTSLERKIGLVPKAGGGWMTVPSVDFVLAATPSAERPDCAEVLCFPSKVLLEAFNKALAARKEQKPGFSSKAPLFVPLDPVERGKAIHPGLKELAQWREDVPLASVYGQESSEREGVSEFIERVAREFAQRFGAKPEDVTVVIQVKRSVGNGKGLACRDF